MPAPAIDRQPISVLMVGIGGYGHDYLQVLLDECSPSQVDLRAVVDPCPEKALLYETLKRMGIKIYPSLKDFYERGGSADLVVISSPLHFHIPDSLKALSQGSHVLCDKPLGTTVQDIDHLMRWRDQSDRQVMVGYQWSYSSAIQALKKDVGGGLWGKPVRFKTLCFWPRDFAYYQRNNWAGKIRDKNGRWILDSPAGNAMAHFLHNLFYILGEKLETSAFPAQVTAELYRVYPIENYDSIACRVLTSSDCELLFYASHAVPQDLGPMFSLEFTQAEVTYGEDVRDIIARDRQGPKKTYGSPDAGHPFKKLFESLKIVAGEKTVICGPEAARPQTLCMNGIQDSVEEITTLPKKLRQEETASGRIWVNDLARVFYQCYQKGILPSEAGVTWARRGRSLDLTGYRFFPGGIIPKNKGNKKNEIT